LALEKNKYYKMNKKRDSFDMVFQSKTKNELIDILKELWLAMDETDQIELLQRYSGDASAAASAFLGPRAKELISEVDAFCTRCLDGYYMEFHGGYYTDYHIEDDWADRLDHYFKLALEYSAVHDFHTAEQMLKALLHVVYKATHEVVLFPAEYPEEQLETDLEKATDAYFRCLAKVLSEEDYLRSGFITGCMLADFGGCNAWLSGYTGSPGKLEQFLREIIAQKSGADFDFERSIARDMVLNILAQKGDSEQYTAFLTELAEKGDAQSLRKLLDRFSDAGRWQDVIAWCERSLGTGLFKGRWAIEIKEKKAEALTKIGEDDAAFALYWELFLESGSWQDLMRVRKLVEPGHWPDLRKKVIDILKEQKGRYNHALLLDALLLEAGELDIVVEKVSSYRGDWCLDQLKMICELLVKESLSGMKKGPRLKAYLARLRQAESTGAMMVMDLKPQWQCSREELIHAAITCLKQITAVHIAAQKRGRYKAAAYYCALLQEIYACSGDTAAFDKYFQSLLRTFPRHRALHEELANALR
jgi:hypothetical protein